VTGGTTGTVGSKSTKLVATAISAGSNHACAVLTDATIQCWGDNSFGELGNATTTNSSVPVMVTGISNATAVSAGFHDTCAVLRDATIQCWGNGTSGQLGNGTTTNSPMPVMVSGITDAVAVAAGSISCAVLRSGLAQCWGENGTDGYLGGDTMGSPTVIPTPATVAGITNALAVAVGSNYGSCAVLSDGTIQCWGDNGYGERGDGTAYTSMSSSTVMGITNAISVSAGNDHCCAVLSDNTIQCWGRGTSGQLGNGATTFYGPPYGSSTPVTVAGITNAIAVTAGGSYTCAILSDGTVQGWGANNYGELGNGTTTSSSVPVSVADITNAMAIATGYDNTCVLLRGGSVQCWGYNQNGQLGDGTTTNRTTPVTVTGF